MTLGHVVFRLESDSTLSLCRGAGHYYLRGYGLFKSAT